MFRKVLKYSCLAICGLNGLALWLFYLGSLLKWVGILGIFLAALVPTALLFPFAYWIIEKEFPLLYFGFIFGILLFSALGYLADPKRGYA